MMNFRQQFPVDQFTQPNPQGGNAIQAQARNAIQPAAPMNTPQPSQSEQYYNLFRGTGNSTQPINGNSLQQQGVSPAVAALMQKIKGGATPGTMPPMGANPQGMGARQVQPIQAIQPVDPGNAYNALPSAVRQRLMALGGRMP